MVSSVVDCRKFVVDCGQLVVDCGQFVIMMVVSLL